METRICEMTGLEILAQDQYLEPYKRQLQDRWADFKHQVGEIRKNHGGLWNFADNSRYGLFVQQGAHKIQLSAIDQVDMSGPCPDVVYREWAGNCKAVSLVGDFNSWDASKNRSDRQDYGVHEVHVPFLREGDKWTCPLKKGDVYKVRMETHDGQTLFRHPSHCVYAQLNAKQACLEPIWFDAPEFKFRHPQPPADAPLRIYETHVGMASEKPEVASFKHFKEVMLPMIKEKHYNCVQIMALQEHSFYGSFGYQVTGFFGVSSRYGTPQEFKEMVDEAHRLGILVLLDLVHSHASKNEADGIARWDGSDYLFHKEDHPLWDSKVFNYTHPECLRFLLQNLRYWLEEYNVDGFRFDGCMSMMYWHRSAGVGYTGRYGEYFDQDCRVDTGALTYLRLAHLLFLLYKEHTGKAVITIAEDVSGYPSLAAPLLQGGLGFDYRFQMAVPDLWIKMMKAGFDTGLNDGTSALEIGKIRHALVNRRYQEKHIVYAECHDQALVGDKTLLMWLLNELIYTDMSIFKAPEPRTQRGIQLHKLIRLLTCSLGGEGYLNFMGNEFGHPEWIDFPRPGNDWSYAKCRRQFNLEKETTRYADLSRFDAALMAEMERFEWSRGREYITREDEQKKIICFERGRCLFVVSFFYGELDVVCPVREPGKFRVVLDSDESRFAGTGEAKLAGKELFTKEMDAMEPWQQQDLAGMKRGLTIFMKPRHGLILERLE